MCIRDSFWALRSSRWLHTGRTRTWSSACWLQKTARPEHAQLETLQELVRRLRKAGAKSDATRGCGVHIHIGAKGHTPQTPVSYTHLDVYKRQLRTSGSTSRVSTVGKRKASTSGTPDARSPPSVSYTHLGSDFGDTRKHGTVKRTQVSNMEIWCECFGKERANIRRTEMCIRDSLPPGQQVRLR